jgi:hypothetical protein
MDGTVQLGRTPAQADGYYGALMHAKDFRNINLGIGPKHCLHVRTTATERPKYGITTRSGFGHK